MVRACALLDGRCVEDLGVAEFDVFVQLPPGIARGGGFADDLGGITFHLHVYLQPLRHHRTRRVRFLGAWWPYPDARGVRAFTKHLLHYAGNVPIDFSQQGLARAEARAVPYTLCRLCTPGRGCGNLSAALRVANDACEHGCETGGAMAGAQHQRRRLPRRDAATLTDDNKAPATLCALRCSDSWGRACELSLQAQGAHTSPSATTLFF